MALWYDEVPRKGKAMRIFISYYRRSGWFAASIFEQWLRDAGIEAIMDQKHFQAGPKLPDELL